MWNFFYRTYHGWRCIDICDFVNDWASKEEKFCHDYAVRAPPKTHGDALTAYSW